MKIIVPMAGRGSRLRPHTLTVPKPLIPIAGKPIVQRLVEDIAEVCDQSIDEIAFIIGDFGAEVEAQLKKVAEGLGAKASIYHQEEPMGTAHAIYCAEPSLEGPVVVAFADTLFTADFQLDQSADGVLWVKQVENPSAFGVVKINDEGVITDFVEKPKEFVSDMAIIGIYYFKDGAQLKSEIKYLLDNDIRDKGEYQITDALENMRSKGSKFKLTAVDEWMDCGNKNVTVETNGKILEFKKDKIAQESAEPSLKNSLVVAPCYIGEGVVIENSKVGPYVSLGKGTVVKDSNLSHCLVQEEAEIINANLKNSMIGNFASYQGTQADVSIGDYSQIDLGK